MVRRQRVVNTLRTVIITTEPGSRVGEKDLQRIRSRLKSIKTKFSYIFHDKLIRFVLTKPRSLVLQRSVCMLFVSIKSCGCEMHCAWTFIVKKLSNILNGRGSLGHLTGVPQEMTGLHFKKVKCRYISEFGIFYRDQSKCVKFKHIYDLRCLPEITYTR